MLDLAIGKNHTHAGHHIAPFVVSVGIVEKHEAAAQKISADANGFGLRKDPGAGIFHKNPRPVINIVASGVDHLLGHVSVDACQANDALHELTIRFGVVGGPALKATKAAVRHVVVETSEGPLDSVFGPDGHALLVFLLISVNSAALVSEQSGGKTEEEQRREEKCKPPTENRSREFHWRLYGPLLSTKIARRCRLAAID